MFQTLTRRDERESTGIGLAVVKKIVELYDGNVWIESEEGKGTTFFFTLPEQMLATNEESAPIEVGPSVPVADGQNITGQ